VLNARKIQYRFVSVLNQQARAHPIDIREAEFQLFRRACTNFQIIRLRKREREREREHIDALDVSLPRIAVKYHTPLKRSDENFQNDRRELRFVRIVLQSRTL